MRLPWVRGNGHSYEFAISATEIRHLAAQLNETATPLREMWPEVLVEFPSFKPERQP